MPPSSNAAGVWTAIATPFAANGEIAWDHFSKHLAQQAAAGVTGVVVCGTTGESPTLSADEKIKLIQVARQELPKSIRVMAGTGGNDTAASVELSVKAAAAGADALLIVTPPYNKPTLSGLKLHFSRIAERAGLPVCLYHVPGRTAQTLTPEAIAELCQIKNVTMVKEASGDVALFSRALLKSGAVFLSGDDPTYLASLAVGGLGCISVASNIYPKEMVALTKAVAAGDLAKARRLHDTLLAVIDVLFCETNPGPLKAALAIKGFCSNTLRAPLAPVSPENYRRISETLKQTDARLHELKN